MLPQAIFCRMWRHSRLRLTSAHDAFSRRPGARSLGNYSCARQRPVDHYYRRTGRLSEARSEMLARTSFWIGLLRKLKIL